MLVTKVDESGQVVERQVEVAITPDTPNEQVAERLEQLEALSPQDFLPALLPESLELQQLAVKLLRDPAPDVALEGWVTGRIEQLMTP